MDRIMPHQIVVDGEPDLLATLCEALTQEGFAVLCLDDPANVVPAVPEQNPALFLLDVVLPGISGIELAQQLRAAGLFQTPLVAISASTTMVSLAQQSGVFHDTVTEPFDLEGMLDTIEQSLRDDRRGAHRVPCERRETLSPGGGPVRSPQRGRRG